MEPIPLGAGSLCGTVYIGLQIRFTASRIPKDWVSGESTGILCTDLVPLGHYRDIDAWPILYI